MKLSFIITVFNEQKTIALFLDSLLAQTKMPQEIIIVDGGSADDTVKIIKTYKAKFAKKKVRLQTFVQEGNRSVGRNLAIKKSTGDIILCSDAGNELDKDWVKNIIRPFKNKKIDVVAGYYEGKATSIFQKSVVPYALVMPDKVNSKAFLPATRSIAFTKKIWQKVGGFDEQLSHNEDYVFAKKLKDAKANIAFAKDAIVYWFPRNTVKQSYIMFFRFALGDAEAGIFRSKVLLILARYFVGLYFIFLCLLYKSIPGFIIAFVLFMLYIVWAIKKNYKYVGHALAFYYLPLLQFVSDCAVIIGTAIGTIRLGMRRL